MTQLGRTHCISVENKSQGLARLVETRSIELVNFKICKVGGGDMHHMISEDMFATRAS